VGIEENLAVNVDEHSLSQLSSTLLNKISETLTALLHSFPWSGRSLHIGDQDGDFHTAPRRWQANRPEQPGRKLKSE
jgi:hypothetical protein